MSNQSGRSYRGAIIVAAGLVLAALLVVYGFTTQRPSSDTQLAATVGALQTEVADIRTQAAVAPIPPSNQQVAQQPTTAPTDSPSPSPVPLPSTTPSSTLIPASPTATVSETPTPTPSPSPLPVSPTPSPVPTSVDTIFSDDFDNGMNAAWRQTEGEWNVVNGQLMVLRSKTDHAVIEVGDDSWDNYSIDFDTGDYRHGPIGAYNQGNRLWLYARIKDEDNSSFFGFWVDMAQCGARIDGKETGVQPSGSNNGFEGTHHVHIEMHDANYKLSVDNETRCSYQDKAFSKGGVRILIAPSQSSWPFIDNFVVKHIS